MITLLRLSVLLLLIFVRVAAAADGTPIAAGAEKRNTMQSATLALTPAESAFIKAHPVIRVSNETDYPPFDFAVGKEPKGFSIDLLNLLAERIGVKVEYVTGPTWDQLVQMHKAGTLDLLHTLTRTPEREKQGLYSNPYIKIKTVFVSRKNGPDITSFDQLQGKTVAVGKGWSVEEFLRREQPGITRLTANSVEQLLNAVSNEQADATIENDATVPYWLNKKGITDLKMGGWVKEIDKGEPITLHFYARKDAPALVSLIDKALESLTPGELQTLRGKWLGTTAPEIRPISLNPEEQAYLKAHPVIRVSNETDYPPFDFAVDGKAQGYSIDLLNLLAERLGMKVEYATGPTWEQLQQMFKEGKLDLLQSVLRTPEREKTMFFSEPYFRTKQVFVSRKGDPDITDIAQLRGKTVAVGKNWAQETFLKQGYPDIKLLPVDNLEQLLDAVSGGRADATFETDAGVSYWLQKKGITDLKLGGWVKEFDKGKPASFYFAAHKNEPQLVSMLNKAAASLTPSELGELRTKWFGNFALDSERTILNSDQQAYLAKKGEIRMCVDPDWMPMERIASNGVHEGMVADMIAKFSEKLATKIVLVPTKTWQESLDLARSRQCDIISAAAETQARKEFMDFTGPYVSFNTVIVTQSRQAYVADIQSVLGETFGVVRGYWLTDELKRRYPNIKLVEVANNVEGLQQVQEGKLFGFLDALPPVTYLIQTRGMLDLKVAGQLDDKWNLSVATRNDEPLLRGILQAAIDLVPPDERRAVAQQWLSVRYEPVADYSLLWKLGFGMTLLALGFIAWNRKLAKFNRSLTSLNQKLDSAHQQLIQSENIAQQSLTTIQSILDTAPVGICLMDAELRYTRVNAKYLQVVGYSSDELLGETPRRLFCSDDEFESFLNRVAAAIGTGQTYIEELQVIDRQGRSFWIGTSISMIDPTDIGRGIVAAVEDISERKKSEREIRESHAQLESTLHDLRAAQSQLVQSEKMASLGQLVASVAHEINTPIAAVKSSGETIADALDDALIRLPNLFERLDVEHRQLFIQLLSQMRLPKTSQSSREERAARRAVAEELAAVGIDEPERIAMLIVQTGVDGALAVYLPLLRHPERELILSVANSIGAVIKGTHNINTAVERVAKIIFALKSFARINKSEGMREASLREGLDTVLTIYQNQLKQGIELVLDLDDVAPLHCLPDELCQVWTNLIHNALQAMNYAGTLTVAIRRVGDEAIVSVSDTGCGIPDEIKAKIFDPFFTTKPTGEGSGLGLDIVKKIIEKHHGRIEVETRVGVGTTFSVHLPYLTESL
ncbi:MAG: transporter substrate-binding domain-containing protein [Rhodocyclaceae bacterium]|jgi:PAS domain S-box-containing protein|nr:transporter substrate-binding domain-containing protein [Rhodocyclaceae bacterium]